MSDAIITKKTRTEVPAEHDWSRFDSMTDGERYAATLDDPDAQPLGENDLKQMKRIPRAKILRRALGLSQEEFAAKFHIPLGTLRDWEQGRCEPDQAAKAYLKVIAAAPETVQIILSPKL